MPRKAVIIVAGGTGTRMNSALAKQFLPLSGKPVLMHTFEAFLKHDASAQLILVLFRGLENQWFELCESHGFRIPYTLITGGKERFHSVQNGISAVDAEVEIIAIHDAVRPLVSQGTISRCFDQAAALGAAIPTIALTDTIRHLSGSSSVTLPRHELRAVQTPQCFRADILKKAYDIPYSEAFTDDASVVEVYGQNISLVEGNRTNVKLTTMEDMIVAEAFLQQEGI